MEGGRGIGGEEAERNEMPSGVNFGLNGNTPFPFLSKTYDMVDDPATDAIVSWGSASNSFVVWNPPEFTRDLLPKYFKHNNFSSFVRQLNIYGFRKVDPDSWEFANEGFLRGQNNLLRSINRRKRSHPQGHSELEQPQSKNPSVTACVEVGKFGFEEVERLKRDNNVLMQELANLRQQQQAADDQLDTLVKRLKVMEQRQQKMMSFLVKAMRSRGLFKQFAQQNDSNRRIAGVGKKRRLPKGGTPDGEMLGGQMVKYQPLINAAAKAVLRQILKINGSPTLESMRNSDNLLIENYQSPSETFESTSSHNSCATVLDVPSNSGVSFAETCSGFSAVYATTSGESDQSSVLDTKMIGADEVTELGVFPSVPGKIALCPSDIDISELLGLVPEYNVIDIENLEVSESHDLHVNPNVSTLEEVVPIETDLSADTDVNFYDTEEKLPGVIDLLCEQFIMASPVYFDLEEVESTTQEDNEFQRISDDILDNIHPLNHITEPTGLLSSSPKP